MFIYKLTLCFCHQTVVEVATANTFNNNNDFFILEDQAQWRNKTKGLSKLVIENNAQVVEMGF